MCDFKIADPVPIQSEPELKPNPSVERKQMRRSWIEMFADDPSYKKSNDSNSDNYTSFEEP